MQSARQTQSWSRPNVPGADMASEFHDEADEYEFGRRAAEGWIAKGLALMADAPKTGLEARERGFCDRILQERALMERCMLQGGEPYLGWVCRDVSDGSARWTQGPRTLAITMQRPLVEDWTAELWYRSKQALQTLGKETAQSA